MVGVGSTLADAFDVGDGTSSNVGVDSKLPDSFEDESQELTAIDAPEIRIANSNPYTMIDLPQHSGVNNYCCAEVVIDTRSAALVFDAISVSVTPPAIHT
ncbi:hypothetical protein BH23CHL2_BH23CHL2_01690 [soil metagenome]